ncbi:MAG: dockerin type I repeat-containing protein [Oscillospiraceae bacterium]|nr:dockerin type I repeat-containing protein [Oscillospiraceae bacterium]
MKKIFYKLTALAVAVSLTAGAGVNFIASAAQYPNWVLYGDVNGDGDIDRLDYMQILEVSAGLSEMYPNNMTDKRFKAADVNKDNEVDVLDALITLKDVKYGGFINQEEIPGVPAMTNQQILDDVRKTANEAKTNMPPCKITHTILSSDMKIDFGSLQWAIDMLEEEGYSFDELMSMFNNMEMKKEYVFAEKTAGNEGSVTIEMFDKDENGEWVQAKDKDKNPIPVQTKIFATTEEKRSTFKDIMPVAGQTYGMGALTTGNPNIFGALPGDLSRTLIKPNDSNPENYDLTIWLKDDNMLSWFPAKRMEKVINVVSKKDMEKELRGDGSVPLSLDTYNYTGSSVTYTVEPPVNGVYKPLKAKYNIKADVAITINFIVISITFSYIQQQIIEIDFMNN